MMPSQADGHRRMRWASGVAILALLAGLWVAVGVLTMGWLATGVAAAIAAGVIGLVWLAIRLMMSS